MICTELLVKDFGLTALGRITRKTRENKITGTWVFFKTLARHPGECKKVNKNKRNTFWTYDRAPTTQKRKQKGDSNKKEKIGKQVEETTEMKK